MAIEIEVKMKVPDHAPVRARLQQLGASKVGEFLETNTFFDTKDQTLLKADSGLRIRQNRNTAAGTEEFILTQKGPRLHGELKSREENELKVSDGPVMAKILDHLGFHAVLSFEKRRESWTLGGCHVELDEVPHLGTFVEIEGPAEEKVNHVRGQLGLTDVPQVKPSYIAMLMNYVKEQGEGLRDIRFV